MKNFIIWLTMTIVMTASLYSYSNNLTAQKERVLIVLTSHSKLGNTGKRTGFWLPELTHPYYEFKSAGYHVDIASPQGGMAPLDAKAFDEPDEYHQDFLNDADLMSKVMRTIPLPSVNPNDYAAIFFSGGSGPMWDFPDNKDVKRIAAAIYQNNGVVSAVCHGTAALINITLATGDYLVKGKRIAAVTREEEVDIGQLEIIPFLLKDKFVERGATHIKAKAWSENIVLDGRLMTGQNPASAKKLSQEVIKYLNNK